MRRFGLGVLLFGVTTAGTIKSTIERNQEGKKAENDTEIRDWSYDSDLTNPKMWPSIGYRGCAGKLQSPIDIITEESEDKVLTNPFKFDKYYEIPQKMWATNNGHTLLVRVSYKDGEEPRVTGGGLPGVFVFKQLHYHWGSDSFSGGSEHTINGKRFPLELHMVHMNMKYDNMSEAVKHPGGTAVFAVLYQLSGKSGSRLINNLVSLDRQIENFNDTVDLSPVALRSTLPYKTNSFYRYTGSLTTPGCQEGVIWTVFEGRAPVSEKELRFFRTRQGMDGQMVTFNFRPIQKQNQRLVIHMTDSKKKKSKCAQVMATAAALSTLLSLLYAAS